MSVCSVEEASLCSVRAAASSCYLTDMTLLKLHSQRLTFTVYIPRFAQVHEDQHIDHTLAQLKQDLTQQLQHQLSGPQQVLHEAAGSGHQSLSASMHVAADTNTAPDTAAASTELQQPEQQPADASFEAAAAAVDEPVMAEAPEQQAAAAAEPAAASPAGPTSESSEKLSCEDESEWQLVSPHGSVRLPGSTGRDSFEYAGVAGATLEVASASSCSGSDTTSSPKDELAESILGNSVLMAAGAAAASGSSRLAGHIAAAAELHTGSDDGMEAVREASLVSAEGGLEGLLGSSQAAAAVAAATEDGAAVVLASPQVEANSTLAAAAGQEQQAVQGIPETEVLTGLGLLRGEIAHLVGAAQGKAVLSLQGLREWLLESLAALVQVGRLGSALHVNVARLPAVRLCTCLASLMLSVCCVWERCCICWP